MHITLKLHHFLSPSLSPILTSLPKLAPLAQMYLEPYEKIGTSTGEKWAHMLTISEDQADTGHHLGTYRGR